MLPALLRRVLRAVRGRFRFFADPATCPEGTLVVLPVGRSVVACGIAAIVEAGPRRAGAPTAADASAAGVAGDPRDGGRESGLDDAAAFAVIDAVTGLSVTSLDGEPGDAFRETYAGGAARLDALTRWARGLKRTDRVASLVRDPAHRARCLAAAERLRTFADTEDAALRSVGARLADADMERIAALLLRVRDIAWHVERESVDEADEVARLAADPASVDPKVLGELRRVAAVLRCIDRIEIRGRDSAGVCVQVSFADRPARDAFLASVAAAGLSDDLTARTAVADLAAGAVTLSPGEDAGVAPCVTFVYKVAAEVGRLGDNVAALRAQVAGDRLLRTALAAPGTRIVVLGHTRWASSGVISVPNCHPVDSTVHDPADGMRPVTRAGRIFVVMNGDVDNHLDLRARYERESGLEVSPRITTDTKVVALEVDRRLRDGATVDEAWLAACREFQGSCALGMVTDLAPGVLFLSLRGSGQSLYVGVSEDGWFASSEVYGVVEETPRYVKLDGEKDRVAGDPSTRGQVVVVSADGPRGPAGVRRLCFDGTPLPLAAADLREAEITTRDVDRGSFDHFFRKEITQSTRSVARTLWGRTATGPDGVRRLSPRILADAVRARLRAGVVKQVLFVGQGTAAVAGQGVAEYMRRILGGTLRTHALPATELSGFHLREDMTDTLVVAVTQSGSSADTNRAVDLARRRGAHVVAIVNRRNSDITYRTDGVVYTSDGRDVEMSVASTKAFYAQLTAGALLTLAVAETLGVLPAERIDAEIAALEDLPRLMEKVFDVEESIREAAAELAPERVHWAVVASGPNQVAGEEVRIKLSELCYKSISTDTVENKKHIDLSCEPLVLVLAAGNPETVLNDVVKDVAIFKAHKALPVVFACEGERRFDPYAAAVIPLPPAPTLGSIVLCALAGHLFGYHAARAIDENARFFGSVRALVVDALTDDAARAALPRTLAAPRRDYLERLQRGRLTSALHPLTAVRLASLFDLTTGTAVDTPETLALAHVGGSGTDAVLTAFANVLGQAVDECARPVDAIKHQAKIVTVGTSRPEEAMQGVVADALAAAGVDQETLVPVDLLELRRMQPAVRSVAGLTRYVVEHLRADGSPGGTTTIRVADRRGVAAGLRSRAEAGAPLTGTKRQVVADRRMYTGVGRGDGRRIAILPMLGADRHVTGLVLLHLDFQVSLPRAQKIELLGAKLERLRDVLAEANRAWDPACVDVLTPEQLVVEDAEDLGNRILSGI